MQGCSRHTTNNIVSFKICMETLVYDVLSVDSKNERKKHYASWTPFSLLLFARDILFLILNGHSHS